MTALTTYVGYPIDQRTLNPDHVGMVADFETMLLDHEMFGVVYDPGDAFTVSPGGDGDLPSSIARVNKAALAASDVLAAFLPAGVPTIGLVIEIERSVAVGRRTAIFTDTKSYSLAEFRDAENVSFHDLSEAGVQEGVVMLHRDAEDGLLRPRGEAGGPAPLPVVVGPGARLPSRGYADDAGLDLYVDGTHLIRPGEFVDIPCGVRVALPEWTWGLITGRSSTLRTKGLLVHSGIIDPGWRGDLFAGAWNRTQHDVWVQDGERIAQLIVLPNVTREFFPHVVDKLETSERGENGFGSTGI